MRENYDELKNPLAGYAQHINKDLLLDMFNNPENAEAVQSTLSKMLSTQEQLKSLAVNSPTNAAETAKEIFTAGLHAQHFVMADPVSFEIGHPKLKSITMVETDQVVASMIDESTLMVGWNKSTKDFFFLPTLVDNGIIGFLLLLTASLCRDFWVLEERTRKQKYTSKINKIRHRQGKGKARKLITQKNYIWAPRFKYNLDTDKSNQPIGHRVRTALSPHLVSGHIRTLPEGWKSSEKAKQHATEFGLSFGDGQTFVRPHKRGEIEQLRTYRSRSAMQLLFT